MSKKAWMTTLLILTSLLLLCLDARTEKAGMAGSPNGVVEARSLPPFQKGTAPGAAKQGEGSRRIMEEGILPPSKSRTKGKKETAAREKSGFKKINEEGIYIQRGTGDSAKNIPAERGRK